MVNRERRALGRRRVTARPEKRSTSIHPSPFTIHLLYAPPLRRVFVRERRAAVLGSAAHRQVAAASARRDAGRVDDVHALLPRRAARRLRLRARLDAAATLARAGRAPSLSARRGGGALAPVRRLTRSGALDARAVRPYALASVDAGRLSRAAVLRALGVGPALSKVVLRDAAQVRARPLLPLRREQRREPLLTPRLPRPLRAFLDARRAAPRVGLGLRRPRRAHHRVRRRRVALRRDARARRRGRGRRGGRRDARVARGGIERRRSGRRGRAGRARDVAATPALGGALVRAVEPRARRDDLRHDGRGRRASAVGRAARALPSDLHPRLRARASPPAPRDGFDFAGRGNSPHARLPFGRDRAGVVSRLRTPRRLLPRRLRLPRAARRRPARRARPRGVLPLGRRGRRPRRHLQRARRARRLRPRRRIPARHTARVPLARAARGRENRRRTSRRRILRRANLSRTWVEPA